MKIENICCLCFSPTGTTRKIGEEIALGVKANSLWVVDCTERSSRNEPPKLPRSTDLAILASPVYYGRMPEDVALYWAALKTIALPAVVLVVYGNRHYDDALLELYNIALNRGLFPIAGAAFIAEHSYSSPRYPIAQGRPDSEDLRKASTM